MAAVYSCERSVNFYETTRRHVPAEINVKAVKPQTNGLIRIFAGTQGVLTGGFVIFVSSSNQVQATTTSFQFFPIDLSSMVVPLDAVSSCYVGVVR
jgi:hypothetical protein